MKEGTIQTIRFYIVALFFAVVVWAPRLDDALFIDEAGSWFQMIKGPRVDLQGETFFYYFILRVWSEVFGSSESALRSLSTICVFLSCILFARVTKELQSKAAIWSLAVATLCYPILVAAVIARPYGLGLLLVLTSLSALKLWRSCRSNYLLAIAALLFAGSLSCHPTFIFLIPLYVYWLFSDQSAFPSRRELLLGSVIFSIAALPAILNSLEIYKRHSQLQFISELPGPSAFASFFAPLSSLFTLLVIGIFKVCLYRRRALFSSDSFNCLRDASVWFFGPKICAAIAGFLVSPVFFVSRYSIISSFGEALLTGCLIGAVAHRTTRRTIGLIVISTLTIPWLTTSFSDTQWRPVLDYVRSQQAGAECKVFAIVGFVEATNLELLKSEPTTSFIRSPLDYYNIPATLLPLHSATSEERKYLLEEVYPLADSASCNIILLWDIASETDSGPSSFRGHLEERNFSLTNRLQAGVVTLQEWRLRPNSSEHILNSP